MERCPDPIDAAADLAEREREELARVRKPVPERTGFCLWCKTPTPGVYCDPECERDHAKQVWADSQRPRSSR